MPHWQTWSLRIVTGFALVAFLVAAYGINESRNQRHELCVAVEGLKKIAYDDHTDQIQRLRGFLKENPHGLRGIETAEQIRESIARHILVRAKYAPKPCP